MAERKRLPDRFDSETNTAKETPPEGSRETMLNESADQETSKSPLLDVLASTKDSSQPLLNVLVSRSGERQPQICPVTELLVSPADSHLQMTPFSPSDFINSPADDHDSTTHLDTVLASASDSLERQTPSSASTAVSASSTVVYTPSTVSTRSECVQPLTEHVLIETASSVDGQPSVTSPLNVLASSVDYTISPEKIVDVDVIASSSGDQQAPKTSQLDILASSESGDGKRCEFSVTSEELNDARSLLASSVDQQCQLPDVGVPPSSSDGHQYTKAIQVGTGAKFADPKRLVSPAASVLASPFDRQSSIESLSDVDVVASFSSERQTSKVSQQVSAVDKQNSSTHPRDVLTSSSNRQRSITPPIDILASGPEEQVVKTPPPLDVSAAGPEQILTPASELLATPEQRQPYPLHSLDVISSCPELQRLPSTTDVDVALSSPKQPQSAVSMLDDQDQGTHTNPQKEMLTNQQEWKHFLHPLDVIAICPSMPPTERILFDSKKQVHAASPLNPFLAPESRSTSMKAASCPVHEGSTVPSTNPFTSRLEETENPKISPLKPFADHAPGMVLPPLQVFSAVAEYEITVSPETPKSTAKELAQTIMAPSLRVSTAYSQPQTELPSPDLLPCFPYVRRELATGELSNVSCTSFQDMETLCISHDQLSKSSSADVVQMSQAFPDTVKTRTLSMTSVCSADRIKGTGDVWDAPGTRHSYPSRSPDDTVQTRRVTSKTQLNPSALPFSPRANLTAGGDEFGGFDSSGTPTDPQENNIPISHHLDAECSKRQSITSIGETAHPGDEWGCSTDPFLHKAAQSPDVCPLTVKSPFESLAGQTTGFAYSFGHWAGLQQTSIACVQSPDVCPQIVKVKLESSAHRMHASDVWGCWTDLKQSNIAQSPDVCPKIQSEKADYTTATGESYRKILKPRQSFAKFSQDVPTLTQYEPQETTTVQQNLSTEEIMEETKDQTQDAVEISKGFSYANTVQSLDNTVQSPDNTAQSPDVVEVSRSARSLSALDDLVNTENAPATDFAEKEKTQHELFPAETTETSHLNVSADSEAFTESSFQDVSLLADNADEADNPEGTADTICMVLSWHSQLHHDAHVTGKPPSHPGLNAHSRSKQSVSTFRSSGAASDHTGLLQSDTEVKLNASKSGPGLDTAAISDTGWTGSFRRSIAGTPLTEGSYGSTNKSLFIDKVLDRAPQAPPQHVYRLFGHPKSKYSVSHGSETIDQDIAAAPSEKRIPVIRSDAETDAGESADIDTSDQSADSPQDLTAVRKATRYGSGPAWRAATFKKSKYTHGKCFPFQRGVRRVVRGFSHHVHQVLISFVLCGRQTGKQQTDSDESDDLVNERLTGGRADRHRDTERERTQL